MAADGVGLPALVEQTDRAWRSADAMRTVRDVYANDRFFTFPRFRETAEYLKRRMEEAGLTRVEVVEPAADGVSQVGYWTMPLAWDAKAARLEILNDTIPADSRMLADYPRIPSSLGMWSGSTPPEGVIAEVLPIGKADIRNLANMNLRGKLVLTEVNPATIKSLLVKAGAVGAINTFTENPGLPDGRQWINAWGDNGWGFTQQSSPLLSFSISPRQAGLLRGLLAAGPVRVKAVVDARYYKGSYPYVTGVIEGASPEEVLALAHTSEQGAHDNATGVAATLEAMATLRRLIAAGSLPKPRRSIRILLMPEMYGSMSYVASNPERIRRTVAAMCVDTPAASYDLPGTEYTFYMNPHVSKDFTDAFILEVARERLTRVRRPWHEKEFTTGTDTYLAEPMVGVPTVWGYSGSGVETHHNSEDTPDRVDERSLRDISVITASFLYFIANAGEDEALWLAGLSEARGEARLQKAASGPTAHAKVAYMLDRESQAISSVSRLVPQDRAVATKSALEPILQRLRRKAESLTARVPAVEDRDPRYADAAKIVVKRKRFGTLPLDDLPQDRWEGYPSGAWAGIPTIALYWCDGTRTLADVIRLTKLELGPTSFDFAGYFRFLARHGYVTLQQAGQ
jgi:hypothetical protein